MSRIGLAFVESLDDASLGTLAERLRPHLERPAAERTAYTVQEVARRCGRSPKTVYRAIATGELLARKAQGRWLITPEAEATWAAPDARRSSRSAAASPSFRSRVNGQPLRQLLSELDKCP